MGWSRGSWGKSGQSGQRPGEVVWDLSHSHDVVRCGSVGGSRKRSDKDSPCTLTGPLWLLRYRRESQADPGAREEAAAGLYPGEKRCGLQHGGATGIQKDSCFPCLSSRRAFCPGPLGPSRWGLRGWGKDRADCRWPGMAAKGVKAGREQALDLGLAGARTPTAALWPAGREDRNSQASQAEQGRAASTSCLPQRLRSMRGQAQCYSS